MASSLKQARDYSGEAVAARPDTRLDHILSRLQELNERAAFNLGAVESFNARLQGSYPVPVESTGTNLQSAPNGRLEEIVESISRIEARVNDLSSQISRLNEIG